MSSPMLLVLEFLCILSIGFVDVPCMFFVFGWVVFLGMYCGSMKLIYLCFNTIVTNFLPIFYKGRGCRA